MANKFDRRTFLQSVLATPALVFTSATLARDRDGASAEASAAPPPGAERTLPAWQAGYLDIHHIATGRGDATFVLLPDGTSLMIDAGVTSDPTDVSVATRPNDTRRAGEWMGRYVKRHLAAAGRERLDYFLLTHLHPDHVGDVTGESPFEPGGRYRLTGLMDVDAIVPIETLVDRGYPNYDYPLRWNAPFATNYFAYVKARVADGRRVERFEAGSGTQLRPLGRVREPYAFEVRNLAANGVVWTGVGTQTKSMFPPLATLDRHDYPNENALSTALRLRYGSFSYFAAGDLTSYTYDGALPWLDVLTEVARACGPVDVAAAPHHGFFDGLSAETVRQLRPQAWMINGWHVSHPDLLQLLRMLSDRLYPGHRDVFATTMMEQNLRANSWVTRQIRSTDGHVIVRVAPGGDTFVIFVTDNRDEMDSIKFRSGPYTSAGRTQRT